MKREVLTTLISGTALSFLLAAVLSLLFCLGFFQQVDNKALDVTQHYLPPAPVDDSPLVYIKIGDISDQPWPWQSLDYAILTHSVLRYFPLAMTMETPFYSTQSGPTVYDSQFKNQLKRINESLITIPLTASGQHIGTASNLRPLATVPEQPEIPLYHHGLWPIEQVANISQLSPQTFPTSPDGRVRTVPLIINYQGKPVASQILSTFATYIKADLPSSGAVMGQSIILKNKQGEVLKTIPINDKGELTLRYYQEVSLRKEVEFYSVILASEQQQKGETPPFDLGIFRNSLITLGKEHPNIMEPISTPHGLMSPAKVQLQALANLINESFVKPIPTSLLVLFTYLAAVGGTLISSLRNMALSIVGILAFALYLVIMILMLFYFKGYWLNPSLLLIAPLLGWMASRFWSPLLKQKFL